MGWNPFVRCIVLELLFSQQIPTFTQLICSLIFNFSSATWDFSRVGILKKYNVSSTLKNFHGRQLIFFWFMSRKSIFFFKFQPWIFSGCMLPYSFQSAYKLLFLKLEYWVQIKWVIACSMIISNWKSREIAGAKINYELNGTFDTNHNRKQ